MKRCIICGNMGDDGSTVCEVCGNPYLDLDEDTHYKEIVEPDEAPLQESEAAAQAADIQINLEEQAAEENERDFAAELEKAAAAADIEPEALEKAPEARDPEKREPEKQKSEKQETAVHRMKSEPQIYGQVSGQQVPGSSEPTGVLRRNMNGQGSAAVRPEAGARRAQAGTERVHTGRTGNVREESANDQRRPGNVQGESVNSQRRSGNVQGGPANGSRRPENMQGGPANGSRRPENMQGGPANGPRRPENVQGGPANGPRRPGNVQGGPANGPRRPGNVQGGPANGSRRPGNVQRGPAYSQGRPGNVQGGSVYSQGRPGDLQDGSARMAGFRGGRIKADSRKILRSPIFVLAALLQTVYLGGSVAAIFMKELNYSQFMRLISSLPLPAQLTGYMDQLLKLTIKLDTDAIAANLVLRIPDLLMCIGLWMVVAAARTKEEEMSGAGFTFMKTVTVIGLIKNGILVIAGLVVSVALVVSAWLSRVQSSIIAWAIVVIAMIVASMMVIMYYFSYIAMLNTFRANALKGESYGTASGYVAAVYVLTGLLGVIGLLSGIVNGEISGIIQSAGRMGWMLLFAVWILMYRSGMREAED